MFIALLLPTIVRPDLTSSELDVVLRKLDQLESTQKRQLQQMQWELDKVTQELTSARAEINFIKSSAVQSKNLFSQSFPIN